MALPIEWDIRAADTHLARGIGPADTTCELAHRLVTSGVGYPAPAVFWATIEPDDPNAREEVIVTAITGAQATIVRGVGYSVGQTHREGSIVRLGTRSGAWPHLTTPTLLNSWANSLGGLASCVYWRTPDGMVYVQGWIEGGATNTVAFTFPVGYRPGQSGSHRFPAVCSNDNFGAVDVDTAGNVRPRRGANNAINLSGVCFMVAG